MEYWIHFPPLSIPFKVFHNQISIVGILISGIIITTLIFAQKKILKLNPDSSILKLTMLGALICFISEFVFQIIRQATYHEDTIGERILDIAHGTFGVTLVATVFSFFIAFQLKTKKTIQLIILIVVVMSLLAISTFSQVFTSI